ncbi:hypothetical protein [Candidatus Methanoplasma termitum]|nr:hypothetical protein [Candidatus Methanoplasma termitum]MCL2333550.1 hypothetical protein [Candidatus Methanoplasma sp.]
MDNLLDDYNDIPKNPLGYALTSLFCGIVGVAILFILRDYAIAAVALGGVGLVVGGYAIGVANHFPGRSRVQYMVLAGAGLIASVMAFMLGFAYMVS